LLLAHYSFPLIFAGLLKANFQSLISFQKIKL